MRKATRGGGWKVATREGDEGDSKGKRRGGGGTVPAGRWERGEEILRIKLQNQQI